jgi:hypothetical protein
VKTTIKGRFENIVIMPNFTGTGIDMNIYGNEKNDYRSGVYLTPDQCGALIFAIEAALECQAVRAAA